MKRFYPFMVMMAFCVLPGAGFRARAQSFEIQQLVLDVQKLSELKSILKDLKDGYQILDAGYSTIRDISQGSFNLHKAFLDGLLAVSPAVQHYKRVADIISLQLTLIARYKSAWGRFSQDPHFSPDELSLMATVYGNLLDQSVKDMSDLVAVVTDGVIRASDAERIREIDGIYDGMAKKVVFMDGLADQGALLSVQRASDEQDLEMVEKLYGITP